QRPRTKRNIIKIKTCTQPFKNFTGNKSDLIRKTLIEMTEQGLLISYQDSTGKVFYELAQ
ncbi:MAG: hypothetical protein PHC99_10170, partial [Methylococcales bacterium]|nr:hypothetical protein [Methylococcales bacterium]